jgi:S1-C subfamily serine protease
MTDILASLSSQLAAAADTVSASIVQVQAHRRPVAGVVFDTDLVLTPAQRMDDEHVAVRRPDGQVLDGTVLGRSASTGWAAVRVTGLGAPVATTAEEPRPGHLLLAVGRTWSGALFTALAPVVVVGGPLRTGRASEIERVVRIGLPPHGALTGGALVNGAGQVLGVVTSMAIRGTTVVVPSALAWAAARDVVAHGAWRQGFIGIGSVSVVLPQRQRSAGHDAGLLVTGVAAGGPADAAGVFVGDVILGLDGSPVSEAEDLLMLLRGDRVGRTVALSVLRGGRAEVVSVAVGERHRE